MDEKRKLDSTEETENNKKKSDGNFDKLDSLLLDDEEQVTEASSAGDTAKFEAFMAEYRSLMNKNISSNDEETPKENDESEFLISLPKKSGNKKNSKKAKETAEQKSDEKWDDGITLVPEEYTDPGEEDKVLLEKLPEEEHVPDFNLGETAEEKEDNFQLSINFVGEGTEPVQEENEKSEGYDPEKPRAIDWIFDIVEMFVFVLIAVMILTSFIFKHSIVEGDSMLNTLEDGDHLIISDVFYSPERGDIVVFEDYSTMLKKAVVKRVIGLPGETVEVKLNDEGVYEVYINGVYLDEEYAYNKIDFTAPGVGKWTVGEGEVFVMGDNRYNSTDSRDSRVGTVEIDSILGKVMFRFYPFDKFGAVD